MGQSVIAWNFPALCASLVGALLMAAAGDARVVSADTSPAARGGHIKPGDEIIEERRAQGLSAPAAAPPRAEGAGPFARLVIRGATLIDGTGAPPVGPVDIVIENSRIAQIVNVGVPNVPIRSLRRPAGGDHEIDADGMYVMPGFIDSHSHLGNVNGPNLTGEPVPAEYVFSLLLAHGITSVREVGSFNGLSWTLEHARKSDADSITAPRIFAYALPPERGRGLRPANAAAWVKAVRDAGAAGIKLMNVTPEVFRIVAVEARKLGLGTAMHHSQQMVADMNARDSATFGLTSMEHWYGLPEALFEDKTVQLFPPSYNYADEQHRFAEAGKLWAQAAPPGSQRWRELIRQLIALDFTIDPTFVIYEASRDVMRAQRAEWHDEYTWPSLWRFFEANRQAHGSYWFYWTTADEIAWKHNYRIWMQFINDFKNSGGRVTVGSDAGFIYQTYGFAYVRELELLQEAGFHPLEVIRAATRNAAQLLGKADLLGTVEPGKKADLVLVGANPLENLKVLYGTGAQKLDDATQRVTRVGGVRWTVKNGIVYDAPALLEKARSMTVRQKAAEAAVH